MKEPHIRFSLNKSSYERKRLNDIAKINPKSTLPESFEYVDLESVVGTEMKKHRKENKATAPSRAQRVAQKGDIFYQTVRPYQKNNFHFDLDSNDFVFSSGYAQIRSEINSEYLFTLLQQDKFLNQVLENCTGTSYPAINPSNLSKLFVTISTNIKEQQDIADFFKTFDSYIHGVSSKVTSLKQIKSACLQSMFPQEGESVPKVRFKGFEDKWSKVTVSDVLVERRELSKKTKEFPLMAFVAYKGVCPKGERYDRSALVNDEENKLYKKTYIGDFIYSSNNLETGSIGLNNYGNATISPVYSIFHCSPKSAYSFIGYYMVRKQFINEMVKWRQGVMYGQWRIHEADFLQIKISLPSLDEQIKIGEFFVNLDQQISLQTQRLEKLKQIKSACLDNMFV